MKKIFVSVAVRGLNEDETVAKDIYSTVTCDAAAKGMFIQKEGIESMKQVYIFETLQAYRPEDITAKRESIKRQIEEGVVVLDYGVRFAACLNQNDSTQSRIEVRMNSQETKQ